MADTPWLSPPLHPTLAEGEVHVWRARLALSAGERALLEASLSAAEQERARRFHFEGDRARFVAARGILRHILARYLAVEPGWIGLGHAPRGKPYLTWPPDPDLRFNMTHSRDLALYALAHGREIGIDVEEMRPLPDADAVAARFFSLTEQAAYRALPLEERQAAFYACWTRKEAYLKALGHGLDRELSSFSVSLQPDEVPHLLEVDGMPVAAGRWPLLTLHPAPGYAAALAVEDTILHLACWEVVPPGRQG